MSRNCPFCSKTVTGEGYAASNGNIALYNLSPILEGHSLIVPEKHYKSLFDMSEDEIACFFSFARIVTAFLCSTYGADAYDWSLQEGMEAGQSVEHLHLHIIPRKPADLKEGEDWYSKLQQQKYVSPDGPDREDLTDSEYSAITLKLKAGWKKWQNAG